ncbi:MAG: N-acetylmuramoyl-L-alanine amidase [bacterium]
MYHRKLLGLFLGIAIIFLVWVPGSEASSLMAVRSWTAPGYTRIVFDLDRPVLFQELHNKDSRNISLELRNCTNSTAQDSYDIDSSLIESVRLLQSPLSSLVAEITTSIALSYHIFYLQKYEMKPDRIVIDIKHPVDAQQEKETKREIEDLKKANWIVAIDPGHGGEDPGALSKEGYREKDIVLAVGKMLRDQLNDQSGIKAYLTRDGDYFLSLRERIEIAHKFQADLFISLHANANLKSTTRGTSVYYLSRDGATDEASALLADKENASDLIGGIPLGKDSLLDSILIDLAQTRTINESIDLGEKVLRELGSIKGLEREGLKCANFGVLKSPSIPSVLVELAYLSNHTDIKMLSSKKYQKEMSQRICQGALEFLGECPPKEKHYRMVAGASASGEDYEIHVVKQGETLWRISSLYGISLDIIRNLNGLHSSSLLMVGQKLKIPSH